jgi:predicted transcriptional regulator
VSCLASRDGQDEQPQMGLTASTQIKRKFDGEARGKLLQTPVLSLVEKGRDIITCHGQDSLKYALELLSSNGISSCPVQCGADWFLLDILDVLECIASQELEMTCKEVLERKMGDKRHLSAAVGDSVGSVVAKMMDVGAHRVMIMQGDRLVHVLTQSALIEWIRDNLDTLHPKPDLSLASLSLYGTPPPIACCCWNDGTLEAYVKMKSLGYTALPVVNELGVMFGFLSARDVKFLVGGSFDELSLTVEEYLAKYRPHSRMGNLDDSLRDLVSTFCKERSHHMFFADDVGAPINVITLTDVLKVIFDGDFSSPLFREL